MCKRRHVCVTVLTSSPCIVISNQNRREVGSSQVQRCLKENAQSLYSDWTGNKSGQSSVSNKRVSSSKAKLKVSQELKEGYVLLMYSAQVRAWMAAMEKQGPTFPESVPHTKYYSKPFPWIHLFSHPKNLWWKYHYHSPGLDRETEAQRDCFTCWRPHSKEATELGFHWAFYLEGISLAPMCHSTQYLVRIQMGRCRKEES